MEPLTSALGDLRTQVRRLTLLSGLAQVFAVLAPVVLAVCALDWWLHLEPPLARGLVAAGIAVLGAALCAVLVVRPLLSRMTDVDVALQIERARSEWRDELSSTVEFARGGCDPGQGSAALQRALIERTAARFCQEDARAFLDTRHAWKWAALATVAALATAAAAAWDTGRAATAVHRLVRPYAAGPWPQRHALRLLGEDLRPWGPATEPLRVAEGTTLTVYVEDRQGRLPDDVTMRYEFADGRSESQRLRRSTVPGAAGSSRELCVATFVPGAGSVRLRAVGGDDARMPWHAVEVVTPPAIEQFRITLTPPEYSGRPPEELAGDAGHVAALVGTHVRVEALTNVPLSSATFRRDGQAQEPVRLGAEGTEFGVEFDVAASGRSSYWFDLVDRHGLRNATPARYEVRGIEDREPVVALEQPATDVTATPTATLPLVISAQDDLGLRQMRLVLADPPSSAGEQVRPLAAPPDGARQVRVEAPLDIGELGLSPGRQLVVRAEATDGFDLAGEHVGKSVSRSVRIVTAEEKLRELHARHAGIAASLERSLVLQSHALQSVRELRIQFAAAGALQPQDMDVLKRVEQDQLRIGGELHDDRRGAERRVREVLDELEWNGIVDAPTQDRLQRLADGLSELRLEVLPRIEQVVTQTRKVAVAGGNASGELAGRLTQTELLQSASVDALAALHDLLAQWRQQFDLQRHVGELLAGQTQLNADTVSVGRRTLTKSQLAPQDQADLARLSDRQNRLAADVERFQKRLQQMSSDPAGSSSAHDGAVLEQAAALLRDSAVVDEMKLVGQQLPRNNIGESLKTQQGILQTLTQLDEALRGMGIPDAETLLRQIVQAEEQLETLHKGQQEAMEQARELAATGMAEGAAVEELRKKQAELADQTNASALQLRRQQLSGPASSAARASRQMREAADRLQQDASGEALDRQQEALDDLQQAQRELAEARRDMELRRALEQFAQLAAMLDALTDRQEQLTNDTARLDEVHSREGRFSRTQLKSLQELAEAQARLQQDTEQLIETVLDTEVFRAALESAGAEMKRAAERLRERLVDEPTQRAQRAAWSGLEDLRQVLAETRPQGGDAPRPGPSAGEDHRTPGWSLVTQVRLLKRMQEDVARRTAVLTAILSDGGTLTAEQQAERERLAAQQARIAGIAAQTLVEMAAPASAPPTGEEPSP